MHRDISAGNILICNKRGKISDLEYARSYEVLNTADNGDPNPTSIHEPQEKEFKTVCLRLLQDLHAFLTPLRVLPPLWL